MLGRLQKATYVCCITIIHNEYMKVRQKILDIIDNPKCRVAIATELGVGEQAITVHIKGNRTNGRMTKMDFLQAISKVSGCPIDEILEEEKVQA